MLLFIATATLAATPLHTLEGATPLHTLEGALSTLEHLDFDGWLAHHGKKQYTVEEYATRKATFESSKKEVVAHNSAYRAGAETYWLALNAFADLSPEEFAMMRATKHSPSQFPVRASAPVRHTPNPDSVDWRTKGAVTKVKNQGGCGSCWAFSATESVESHYQIASGNLLELAPQTYVDCVENPHSCGGTGGCEGATMELAFNLTMDKGLATEADMPYKQRDEECTPYKAAVKATGYIKNPVNDAAVSDARHTAPRAPRWQTPHGITATGRRQPYCRTPAES